MCITCICVNLCIYIFVGRTDERGVWVWKRKFFAENVLYQIRPQIRPVLGQIVGRIAWGIWKKIGTVTALNPARNRPDCDMSQLVTSFDRLFLSYLSYFLAQNIFIPSLVQPCTLRERKKALHFLTSISTQILSFNRWIYKLLRTSAS